MWIKIIKESTWKKLQDAKKELEELQKKLRKSEHDKSEAFKKLKKFEKAGL